MRILALWRKSGKSRRIRWSGCGSQPKILLRKPVGRTFGSYLGGGLRQNKGGFLVRDDLPLQTHSARTEAAQLQGWTYHSGSCLQIS